MSVEACTTHDLLDQPVRWLTAAAELAAGADLHELLSRLLGPHRERWSATEHSRAAALQSLAHRLGTTSRVPAPRAGPAPVQYAEASGPDGVEARIGRHVVGRAHLTPVATEEGVVELAVEVDPSWRRLGIGTTLLHRACALAARAGAGELVLSAPAEDDGFVTMVCGSGMRARIRRHGGRVVARVTLAGTTAAATSASGRVDWRR